MFEDCRGAVGEAQKL
ncbi:hypothetical protein BN1723_018779, partial [Verticillium longisporum]